MIITCYVISTTDRGFLKKYINLNIYHGENYVENNYKLHIEVFKEFRDEIVTYIQPLRISSVPSTCAS